MPRLAIILTPGFADWEYALLAGTGGPFYGLEVEFFGAGGTRFQSQGGLPVQLTQAIDALPDWDADVIAVIGGAIWETDAAPDLSPMLQGHHAAGGTVGGICGGTLALARAGVLNGRRHTSNAKDFLEAHGGTYDGGAHYVETPAAVAEDRVITAPGTAPVSFTAEVFRAAGVGADQVEQFRGMLGAEHNAG